MALNLEATKGKKLDFINIKNFCASKDTNKKWKDNPQNGWKIFANHISDKGPVSRIYKELLKEDLLENGKKSE